MWEWLGGQFYFPLFLMALFYPSKTLLYLDLFLNRCPWPYRPSSWSLLQCGLLSCHRLNLSVLGAWPLSIPTSSTVVMDNLSSATLYFRNIWMNTLRDALCFQYVALPCLPSDSALQTSHTTTVALTDTAWMLSSTTRGAKGKKEGYLLNESLGELFPP